MIGKAVVEKLEIEEQIIDFIILWRQHFLDVNKPRFLPPAWDVNHKFSRDFGKDSIFYNNKLENAEKSQVQEDGEKNEADEEDVVDDI